MTTSGPSPDQPMTIMPDAGNHGGNGNRAGAGRAVIVVVIALLAVVAATAYELTRPGHHVASTQPATAAATQPQTAPATQATTRSVVQRGPTTQYLDAVRANYPRMPETRPMDVPLDLAQAARLVFREPVYLSPGRLDLWVTRPDAPPTETVLARAIKEQGDQLALVVSDVVEFVHWMPREEGPWTFNVIARRRDGNGYELITQSGRKPIGSPGRHYHWQRALDWNDKIVVATDTGVSVFQFEPSLQELHQELAAKNGGGAAAPDLAEPQFLLDWQGLLAWIPWERGKAGSRGAARFVDGRWSALGPEQGWPEKLLHLVPLYDGSVLRITAKDGGQVGITLASLEQVKVDEAQITKQVEALSDPDDNVRQNAYKELTRYGPSAAPVLERLLKEQEPEAQARLRQLIKSQVEPTLGGMTLLGDQLRVVSRLSDGGAVFYAEAGVMMPGPDDTPVLKTPAWLSLRPGQAVELLDAPFTTDLNPDRSRIQAFGAEWVVTSDVRGPQRFVGNGFVPLLRKSEVAAGFTEPVGIDRRGRWLFRKPEKPVDLPAAPAPAPAPAPGPGPGPAPGPATAPAPPATGPAGGQAIAAGVTTREDAKASAALAPSAGAPDLADVPTGATLILDPTLPDPTPRLPVWVYKTAETVGWDKDNWPVVKRGGAWALTDSGWRALRSREKVFTKPEEAPEAKKVDGDATPPPLIAATEPVAGPPAGPPAGPSSNPATTTTSPAEDLGPLLLTTPDGTRYHDGRDHFRIVSRDGKRIDWPLPGAATGTGIGGKVYLVASKEGLLFLFNQPGRVVRIRPTPGADEPFTVDATFTRNVPSADSFTRVWLDPAGRIILAYEARIAILFPGGYVPPAIARLIPVGEAEIDDQ